MELPNLQPIVDAGARWVSAAAQAQEIENTWIDTWQYVGIAGVGCFILFIVVVVVGAMTLVD